MKTLICTLAAAAALLTLPATALAQTHYGHGGASRGGHTAQGDGYRGDGFRSAGGFRAGGGFRGGYSAGFGARYAGAGYSHFGGADQRRQGQYRYADRGYNGWGGDRGRDHGDRRFDRDRGFGVGVYGGGYYPYGDGYDGGGYDDGYDTGDATPDYAGIQNGYSASDAGDYGADTSAAAPDTSGDYGQPYAGNSGSDQSYSGGRGYYDAGGQPADSGQTYNCPPQQGYDRQ